MTGGVTPGGTRRPFERQDGTLPGVDDDDLLARAEEALTQIKVAQGLSEEHAAVLAALRIRLKGSAGKSLEEMLEAARPPPAT